MTGRLEPAEFCAEDGGGRRGRQEAHRGPRPCRLPSPGGRLGDDCGGRRGDRVARTGLGSGRAAGGGARDDGASFGPLRATDGGRIRRPRARCCTARSCWRPPLWPSCGPSPDGTASARRTWVGLYNFKSLLFESDSLWSALGNNLFLMVVPALVVVPIALAVRHADPPRRVGGGRVQDDPPLSRTCSAASPPRSSG